MLGLGSSIVTSPPPSGGGTRVLIASYDFNDDTGASNTSTTLPTGWAKADSGNFTLYGSTTDYNLTTSQDTKGWVFQSSNTTSSNTGPIGGHTGGPDTLGSVITSGVSDETTAHRYLLAETSNPMAPPIGNEARATIIRTEELDFSAYTSVEITFWFHAFGATYGSAGGTGIAVTTSATSASSAVEAGSGLGFTSYTAGGAGISFTDLSGTAKELVRIGSEGQVQTDGHASSDAEANRWIKATSDLSAAAGQSSVYIHFAAITNPATSSYTQDTGIDSISIIGTT